MIDDIENLYSLKDYEPGMEKEIVELLDIGFNGWPKIDLKCSNVDFWRWKYLDNSTGIVNLHVIMDDDKIISCDHCVPHFVKIMDKVELCGIRADLTIHPDYRGKNLWRMSAEYATVTEKRDGIKMIHYLTGNPIVVKRMIKNRPQFPHQLVNLVRVQDIDKHLEYMPMERDWLIRTGFKAVSFLKNFTKSNKKISAYHKYSVERVDSFDDEIDGFWSKVREQYFFIVERDEKYLNWRYCDPRSGGHVVYLVRNQEEITGYMVVKINKYFKDYPIGFIVDLLTLPEEFDSVEILLKKAIDYFDENNVNIINYLMVKDHPYSKIVSDHGFLDSRVNIHKFYYPLELAEEMNDLSKTSPAEVFFSWGDHDSLPMTVNKI